MCTKPHLATVLSEVCKTSEKIYGSKLNKIILYGSYARNDNTEESDIDILILLDCEPSEVKRFRGRTTEMSSDISLEQEVFLSILLRDCKNFEENMSVLPFYQNIVREGITVYG